MYRDDPFTKYFKECKRIGGLIRGVNSEDDAKLDETRYLWPVPMTHELCLSLLDCVIQPTHRDILNEVVLGGGEKVTLRTHSQQLGYPTLLIYFGAIWKLHKVNTLPQKSRCGSYIVCCT